MTPPISIKIHQLKRATGSNNARAKRINRAIEELKRIGRIYRNKQNFKTAILFFHCDLNGFSHTKK